MLEGWNDGEMSGRLFSRSKGGRYWPLSRFILAAVSSINYPIGHEIKAWAMEFLRMDRLCSSSDAGMGGGSILAGTGELEPDGAMVEHVSASARSLLGCVDAVSNCCGCWRPCLWHPPE